MALEGLSAVAIVGVLIASIETAAHQGVGVEVGDLAATGLANEAVRGQLPQGCPPFGRIGRLDAETGGR